MNLTNNAHDTLLQLYINLNNNLREDEHKCTVSILEANTIHIATSELSKLTGVLRISKSLCHFIGNEDLVHLTQYRIDVLQGKKPVTTRLVARRTDADGNDYLTYEEYN